MGLKSYIKLQKENKKLKEELEFNEIKSLEEKASLRELLANIESTAVQNNYNNTSYKSKKIIELIRDYQDANQL